MTDILSTIYRFAGKGAATTALAAATVTARIDATFRKDYRRMIEVIDEKIAGANDRLNTLEGQRRTLALDAIEADTDPAKASKLKSVNADIEKEQKRLADLEAARSEAVARQEAEQRRLDALSEAERRKVALAAHEKMIAAAAKAEKALDGAAAALLAAYGAKNDFVRAWPPKSGHDVVFTAWGALPACIGFKLRQFGHFKPLLMTEDQSHWLEYFPSAERLGLIEPTTAEQ